MSIVTNNSWHWPIVKRAIQFWWKPWVQRGCAFLDFALMIGPVVVFGPRWPYEKSK